MNQEQSENHPVAISLEQVNEFLRDHFNFDKVESISPIGKGQWSKAFSFGRDGKEYVIRFGTSDEGYRKDQAAAEFSSPSLPIPSVLEIGKALDHSYAISHRAFGEPIDELEGDKMKEMIPSIFRMFDAMRLVDLSSVEGYGFWSPDRKASHQTWREYLMAVENDNPTSKTHGWLSSLKESPTGLEPFTHGVAYLKSLIDKCPEERHLVHTDLLYYNVLVSGNKISAVVDWGNSIYGDFLYDLANFSFWSPWYPSMSNIDWTNEAKLHFEQIGLDVPNFEQRLRACEIHIGLSGMSWNAYKKNWVDLEATTKRLVSLIK